jgi:hypothetical protein
MRDASLVENRPNTMKVHALIKSADGDLRMQVNLARMHPARNRNRPRQQFCANAFAPIAFQHRHTADLGCAMMQHDSCRPNRSSAGGSKKMRRPAIVVIQLDRARHALLLDEHPDTYGEGSRKFCLASDSLYRHSRRFFGTHLSFRFRLGMSLFF